MFVKKQRKKKEHPEMKHNVNDLPSLTAVGTDGMAGKTIQIWGTGSGCFSWCEPTQLFGWSVFLSLCPVLGVVWLNASGRELSCSAKEKPFMFPRGLTRGDSVLPLKIGVWYLRGSFGE